MSRSPWKVKRFKKTVSASTALSEVIAAPGAGFSILIRSLTLTVGGTATKTTLKSASTELEPPKENDANGGYILPPDNEGWLVCADNEAFNLTTDTGSTTYINGTYMIAPTNQISL